MRCPVCTLEESIIAHTGLHLLGNEEIFQRTRVCLGCGLTFEEASPDQDWASLDGTLWRRDVESEGFRDELHDRDALEIGPGQGRSAFEVGCGAGFLLDRLAAAGWRTEGCDPDAAVAEIARAKGHAVRVATVATLAGQQADLVILCDVLEHSPAPLEMLAAARALLAKGGTLYVRVPDLLKVDFERVGDIFGLQQRVWFTADSLRGTLAHAGFRTVRSDAHAGSRNATAVLAPPEPLRRPRAEPGRSLEIVQRYSRELSLRREHISTRLSGLRGKRVALWGGGVHASELLAFTELGWIASQVVDRDPALWSTHCADHVIEPPQNLFQDPPEVVVIASKASQDSIAAELAPLAARGTEVMRLYEQDGNG